MRSRYVFNRSRKRLDFLRQCIKDHAPHTKKQLEQLCETRWIERHDAIISFLELFKSVILALEICGDLDANTSSMSCMLLNSLRKLEFLVAVVVLESVLLITLSLSQALQRPTVDLIQALSDILYATDLLKHKRDNAEHVFADFWLQISNFAKQCDVVIAIPRQVAHQTQRASIPANDAQ